MPNLSNHLDHLIKTIEEAGRLKSLKRAGWVRVGLPEVESVADHSYRVALLALLLGPRLGLDPGQMMRIALIHDLGEARLGDITPADQIPVGEKHAREAVAFGEVVGNLPEASALFDLWREYAQSSSPEARAVRQLDKLELAFQALEYERRFRCRLDEFWASVRAALTEPLLIEIFEQLGRQRP